MLSFVVCQQQQLRSVFHIFLGSYQFGCASFCELRHSGFSPLCPWQILVVVVFVGPCPVRFLLCFSAGWRSAYLAGGSAFRPLRFVVVVVCFFCYDLPTYMTTGVHVDVILTCFFSCKDRASERYRPHQRKKSTVQPTSHESPMLVAIFFSKIGATSHESPMLVPKHNNSDHA